MDLKATLNLPDPQRTVPMKANLPQLEPRIQAEWDEGRIYHRLQEARADADLFVLHDGPPYTNGPIHEGTALNKTLKDFVLKSQTLMGKRAPYVPGYDNHGLPIEQAVTRKLRERKEPFDDHKLRQECRKHAQEYIEIQTEQFRRLGVFGLWERPYRTMDPRFEAGVVRVFGKLVQAGLVYRGLRPTLWSPTLRTSLADADTVYREDHVSKAIYVAFPPKADPDGVLNGLAPQAVIWTTTPWTIPANLALAFHPEFEYAVVETARGDAPDRDGRATYLVASALVPRLAEVLGWADPRVVLTLPGRALENAVFAHPIYGRDSRAVLADYVTAADGTGIVHTAPSHGRDDFLTGQRYGLDVPNTVDEGGALTEATGEFHGLYWKDGDTAIVDRLRGTGALLHASDYVHSYPYADRDDKPVIFRATEQWFVAVGPIRDQMLEEVSEVAWFPLSGENRISAMVQGRPDWCVSRQRPWGVGIPVFYGKESGRPVFDPAAIEAVARLVEEKGSEAWFSTPPEEILPKGYTHEGETEFTKETDVFDVWFDAGSTSLNVLAEPVYSEWESRWPADLYLEGSDQHRGWFNLSLILATGVRGHAPYRQVVTHGWVTDERGRKISKRLGNGVDPIKTCETYGADVLRLWAASVKWEDDVPIGDTVLKQAGETYRNLRNALRFLIGAANQTADPAHPPQATEALDRWIVLRTAQLSERVQEAYRTYRFGDALSLLHDFARDTLSRFYLDVIKDRLYCDAGDSPRRRSAEAGCRVVAEELVKLLAPIAPHTAEEAWDALGHRDTVFVERMGVLADEDLDLEGRFGTLLQTVDEVSAAFEPYKGTEGVKDRQDALATITTSGARKERLEQFEPDDLATFLRVSGVELEEGPEAVHFRPSPYAKCARSRIRRPDVATVTLDGEAVPLTARDRLVLGIGA